MLQLQIKILIKTRNKSTKEKENYSKCLTPQAQPIKNNKYPQQQIQISMNNPFCHNKPKKDQSHPQNPHSNTINSALS